MSAPNSDKIAVQEESAHRAEQERVICERLRHIRELDPNLPFTVVASRLRIPVDKARRLSKEMGLPSPQTWRES